MAFMDNIGFKLTTSVLIALISLLYQLETDEELAIIDKNVMLSKNRTFIFNRLSNLEEFPAVNSFFKKMSQTSMKNQ